MAANSKPRMGAVNAIRQAKLYLIDQETSKVDRMTKTGPICYMEICSLNPCSSKGVDWKIFDSFDFIDNLTINTDRYQIVLFI